MSDNRFTDFEYKAWQAKAHLYDRSWGQVTAHVIPDLLKFIPYQTPTENTQILDCGCGPGQLIVAAAAGGGRIVGIDFSPEMVAIAQRNITANAQALQDVQVAVGDVTSLSFESATFDIVFLNYVLLHLATPADAVKEAARVSRNRVGISIWLPPQYSPGLKLIFDAVNSHADRSVIPPASDPFALSDADLLDQLFSAVGFKRLSSTTVNTAWQVETGEDFFKGVQAGTRLGGLVDLQKPEVKELIKHDILIGIEKFKVRDRYHIPTPSLLYVAEKDREV